MKQNFREKLARLTILALLGIHCNLIADTTAYPSLGFDWENNMLGLDNTVHPHFDPIKHISHLTQVAGRNYQLQNNLYPTMIQSAGLDLLDQPINLELQTTNSSDAPLSFTTSIKKNTPAELVIENQREYANYKITTISTLEPDGFLKVDTTVHPKKQMTIENLALIFPLQTEQASHYRRYLAYDYVKQRIDRNDLLGASGKISRNMNFEFNPVIWIGSEGIGLEVLTETNTNHNLRSKKDAHFITSAENHVTLTNTIINIPTLINTPYSFSFALIPTPTVRNIQTPRNRILTSSSNSKSRKNLENIYIGHWRRDGLPIPGLPTTPSEPSADLAKYERLRTKLHRSERPYIPYSALHIMANNIPELDKYRKQWSAANARSGSAFWKEKLKIRKPIQPVSLDSKSIQDFILQTHLTAYQKNPFEGIYFDVAAPTTLAHTTERYLKRHEIRKSKNAVFYPIYAHRKFLQRYWKTFKSLDPDFLIIHHGQQLPYYALSFIDIAVFGEGIHNFFEKKSMNPKVHKTESGPELRYSNQDNYIPDYFALAEELATGIRHSTDSARHALLPQVNKFNKEYLDKNKDKYIKWTRSALAIWLLNDFTIWSTRIHQPTFNTVLKVLDDFPEYGASTFTKITDSLPTSVKGALYEGELQSLYVYANYDNNETRIQPRVLQDVYMNENTTINGGNIIRNGETTTLSIPPHDFVIILTDK